MRSSVADRPDRPRTPDTSATGLVVRDSVGATREAGASLRGLPPSRFLPVRTAKARRRRMPPGSPYGESREHPGVARRGADGTDVQIYQVTVTRYRGWEGPAIWRPGARALLIGPNNGGKSSLLRAIDLILDPHRNAYRDTLSRHDFHGLATSQPVEIQVVLHDLTDEDCDVFEPYLEGQREDGTFGGFDSPQEEFDESQLVLRLALTAELDTPARAVFARPDANAARVTQEHKLRIGWHFVPAGLDPLRELAFYQGSVFAKLFERVDLSAELDDLRAGIEQARAGLMANTYVNATRRELESAALRLSLTSGTDSLDFHVLSMSDRRVLQSLEPVLRGRRTHDRLPLRSHGAGALRILLLAAVLQQARLGDSNLILALEEPEQNLEPINQRLVARNMLFADSSSAAQTLVSTHSPAVLSTRPLQDLHLVRDDEGHAAVRPLSTASPADHRLFERYARTGLVDGLYADAVLLVEGPTERGGLPPFWSKAFPVHGMEEHRVEIVDCESIDRMAPYVRFFRAVAIPVVALCDCDVDKADQRADILNASPNLLVHWGQWVDWEGVLGAHADIAALAGVLDALLVDLGGWGQWGAGLRDTARVAHGDPGQLGASTSVRTLVGAYPEAQRRAVLTALLRGGQPAFKSARDHRFIAEALPDVPKPMIGTMLMIHEVAARNPFIPTEFAH